MERYASELTFISRINPDGSGVEPVDSNKLEKMVYLDSTLNLSCLSITQGTYIAHGMNSYVVKLKNPPKRMQS